MAKAVAAQKVIVDNSTTQPIPVNVLNLPQQTQPVPVNVLNFPQLPPGHVRKPFAHYTNKNRLEFESPADKTVSIESIKAFFGSEVHYDVEVRLIIKIGAKAFAFGIPFNKRPGQQESTEIFTVDHSGTFKIPSGGKITIECNRRPLTDLGGSLHVSGYEE